jgi:hypothetical protein
MGSYDPDVENEAPHKTPQKEEIAPHKKGGHHHELDKGDPPCEREGCQSLQGQSKGDAKNALPKEVDVEGYKKHERLGGCHLGLELEKYSQKKVDPSLDWHLESWWTKS